MFVQIIQGKVRDADLLRRQSERWRSEIKPKAAGYLGSTSGTTDDGEGIVIVRFESEDAARENSQRPEQASWWEQTAPAFEGEATFHDCRDADLMLGGGSANAEFVQVIQARAVDKEQMRTQGRSMEEALRGARPDILGGLVAWHDDRDFTQVVYFISEDAARKGESASEGSPEMEGWDEMLEGSMKFLDLRDPEFD